MRMKFPSVILSIVFGVIQLLLSQCLFSNAFIPIQKTFGNHHHNFCRSDGNVRKGGVDCYLNIKKNDEFSRSNSTSSLSSFASYKEWEDFIQTPLPPVRPDPLELVSAQDDEIQEFAYYSIWAFLGFGTAFFVNILTLMDYQVQQSNSPFLNSIYDHVHLPFMIGYLSILTGLGQLYYLDSVASVVPPNGSWGGIWNVPAPGADIFNIPPQKYHACWTGLAQIACGYYLASSSLGFLEFPSVPLASGVLGLLLVAMTPINIYMFTHDKKMEGFKYYIPYPNGHVIRGIIQCVIFAVFWKMTFD